MIIIELAKINTACSMGHFLPSAEKFLLKELASSTSYFLKKSQRRLGSGFLKPFGLTEVLAISVIIETLRARESIFPSILVSIKTIELA